MMPITEEVHAFLTANAAAQIQRDDEYLDPADGLLHCKTCHGFRQTVIPAPGGTGFLRPRCLCPCQSAAEKQRKAAEEKRERLERIQRRKAHEPETISLAGRIAPDDEHDRCCCRPWHFQSRSVQARPQCRFPGVSDRQTHRCLAGKLPRLAGPAVHRTKMCLSAKSTRYFTVLVVVV